MALTQDEARGMAAEFGAMARRRDSIIAACSAAGLTDVEIGRLMGLSRPTVAKHSLKPTRLPDPAATAALDQLRARLAGQPTVSESRPWPAAPPVAANYVAGAPVFRSWGCSGCSSPLVVCVHDSLMYCDACCPAGHGDSPYPPPELLE